jgi:two-component system response regulator MprA
MRVLVVDDDPGVRDSLRLSLVFNGYEVELAEDGQRGLSAIALRRPDAVVLDVMMPGLDGLETCRRLRAAGEDIPVLMLTARESVADRVSGLLARLRSLLRRSAAGPEGNQLLRFSDLSLDLGTREVWRGQRSITLTRTEFHLLELLLRHPRQVLERGQILEEVWGFDFPTTANSLEVYVGYLRRKLEAEGESRLIHTVRGVGYSLRETPA